MRICMNNQGILAHYNLIPTHQANQAAQVNFYSGNFEQVGNGKVIEEKTQLEATGQESQFPLMSPFTRGIDIRVVLHSVAQSRFLQSGRGGGGGASPGWGKNHPEAGIQNWQR